MESTCTFCKNFRPLTNLGLGVSKSENEIELMLPETRKEVERATCKGDHALKFSLCSCSLEMLYCIKTAFDTMRSFL